MAFNIQLQPEGKTFECKAYETILSAALDAGHVLPFGCQNGTCGKCKGDILSGEVDYGEHTDAALSDAEKADGKALFCAAMPQSDLSLLIRQPSHSVIPPRILPVRVEEKTIVTEDVMIMTLKLPSQERLQFKAGQYIEFLLEDGKRRAFSIANAPHIDQSIELHLRLVPEGEFTTYAFEEMPEKTIMRIEGAMGDFYLREEPSDKPVLMVATGTGFAPLKGMIEHMLAQNIQREVSLYWGARTLEDLYQREIAQEWAENHGHIRFIPVLSRPLATDEWDGFTGYVQDAVIHDFESGVLSGHALSQYDIYCCGVPEMVSETQAKLIEKGANADAFFADLFSFSKPGR